ncbi:MAG TPA: HAD family hydrolase [Gemmatimonadales bacterium]|jgi:D-glycero-D-manno-heptose 1,7-bisphosphate phosphatase
MTGNGSPRRAVFLDRDGTLIDDPGYVDDPARVHLLPGVAEALQALERAGFLRIIITNQSAIGRGWITSDQYLTIQREVERQLIAAGASIDATYHCPHTPDAGCTCRKPGTALHREAVASWTIDVAASWCVGDQIRDLEPARELGCRSLLVRTGKGAAAVDEAVALGAAVADDLAAGIGLLTR